METTTAPPPTTEEPMSRQRAYQLRHMEQGLCISCSKPALQGSVKCKRHARNTREGLRKRFGYRKRYRGSKSYDTPAPTAIPGQPCPTT